jgi:RsmE family RNA methyltransferase
VNTLLLTPAELAGDSGRVRLGADRRVEHVRTVHRAAVGDALAVGVLGGRLGRAVVTRLDESELELDVTLDRDPPAPLPLVLVLALPRPKVMRRVLQSLSALGVKRLVLLNAWKVEKSYWESPLLTPDAVRAELALGLEQSGDTILPAVTLHRLFKPFVEDELDALAGESRRLLAHPSGVTPCPHDVRAAVALVVGPEGGFTDYEVGALEAQGFTAVSIGPRVLRVEQAVPALVGRLF